MKHYPIARKKWNEKLFFTFFQKLETHFFVLTRVKFLNFNDVIKLIDTKIGKHFFQLFLTEDHNTRASALLTTCKRNIRTEVFSRVLISGNFVKGMALPKASSLSSLHAWFRLHIG